MQPTTIQFADGPNGRPRLSKIAQRASLVLYATTLLAIGATTGIREPFHATPVFYAGLGTFLLAGTAWVIHRRTRPLPTRQEVHDDAVRRVAALQKLIADLQAAGAVIPADLVDLDLTKLGPVDLRHAQAQLELVARPTRAALPAGPVPQLPHRDRALVRQHPGMRLAQR